VVLEQRVAVTGCQLLALKGQACETKLRVDQTELKRRFFF